MPELGIRMALGAQRQTLLAMVIRQGMIPAAAGLATGLLSAWLVSRVLSSLLFGISPRDPMTFATVAGLLGVVALVACALPAWRATRVDPLKALRVE
jgi:putative ABC transport system permease protein